MWGSDQMRHWQKYAAKGMTAVLAAGLMTGCGSDKKAVASYRRRNNNIATLKPYVLEYYYKLYIK